LQHEYILTQEAAAYKIKRLALEVAEQLEGDNAPLVIIGIQSSGSVIAGKVAALLKGHIQAPVKVIDASLNKQHPSGVSLSETPAFDGSNVLICDDVANSGKTLTYALQPLLQYHPKRIQTLVLVERMHKLFPVKPDYVGLSVATTLQDTIVVEVQDGEVMGAYIQ
jgi:pyrimidine operon attenuation protein/uracil phosphoribosyltransferase